MFWPLVPGLRAPGEQVAILDALDILRDDVDAEHHPDGFNIAINAGAAAGQTVFHHHVHLIPRFHEDVPDPRGGVRHVIPWKGRYGAAGSSAAPPHPRPLIAGMSEPTQPDPLFHHLRPYLQGAARIDILVAFLLRSGLRRLEGYLREALLRGVGPNSSIPSRGWCGRRVGRAWPSWGDPT